MQMFSASILTAVILFFVFKETYSVVCYQCDGEATAKYDCTSSTNCTGKACIIYQPSNGVSTTAFCVHDLPKQLDETIHTSRKCWLEPDGKGKHCICGQNFCNEPRNPKTLSDSDALPIENATMIKRNPLIDYDELWEDDDNGMNAKPPPINFLFPGSADIDPRIAGDDSKANELVEDDLVPVDHDNYEYEEDKSIKTTSKNSSSDKKSFYHHRRANSVENIVEKPNSGKISIPPVFLLFFSSAAAIARLFS